MKKKISPPQQKYLWVGESIYHGEKKWYKYHIFIWVGDQKWEIVEIIFRIFFFAWDLYALFFIQGVFKSHLKKNHPHLKCQFPPKIPIWPKSLLYKCFGKWLSPPPPLLPPSPKWGCELCLTITLKWSQYHDKKLWISKKIFGSTTL